MSQTCDSELLALEELLRQTTSCKPFVSAVYRGKRYTRLAVPGRRYWFEYHCWEHPKSGDAKVWYHSHQQCEILGFADCDPPLFCRRYDRLVNAAQLLYRVRFDDGLVWDVFEDELFDDPGDFFRPDPPVEPKGDE